MMRQATTDLKALGFPIRSSNSGVFPDFKGKLMFSPDDLVGSRFDFDVDVKSINTGNSKRDGHLNSADFFGSGKYPKVTFISTAVKHVEGNYYVVQGKMVGSWGRAGSTFRYQMKNPQSVSSNLP